MRIRVTDQVKITAVQTDVLRRGDEFSIDDARGAELLARLPAALVRLPDPETSAGAPDEPAPAVARSKRKPAKG